LNELTIPEGAALANVALKTRRADNKVAQIFLGSDQFRGRFGSVGSN
jgi:hypothetical protein